MAHTPYKIMKCAVKYAHTTHLWKFNTVLKQIDAYHFQMIDVSQAAQLRSESEPLIRGASRGCIALRQLYRYSCHSSHTLNTALGMHNCFHNNHMSMISRTYVQPLKFDQLLIKIQSPVCVCEPDTHSMNLTPTVYQLLHYICSMLITTCRRTMVPQMCTANEQSLFEEQCISPYKDSLQHARA